MRILGLDFFEGTVSEAVDLALGGVGLIVAPSGTCFTRLRKDLAYRTAMTHADLILPDSGLMVSLWRMFRGERIERVSGLAYLRELLGRTEFRQLESVLWILPDEAARDKTLGWLWDRGFTTKAEDCYVAPLYGSSVEDPSLRLRIETTRPVHVVIALSGGVQEKLGFYLRQSATHRPTVHCLGAAVGFVTGYQVAIPGWADRLFLGWLLRLVSNPRRFLPRVRNAFALPGLIRKYGKDLPPVENADQ
jgi:N-acetylglucosaminyldiphosphoundecaprenol N-acetyl-beta-D-mannosaminyltransferase